MGTKRLVAAVNRPRLTQVPAQYVVYNLGVAT